MNLRDTTSSASHSVNASECFETVAPALEAVRDMNLDWVPAAFELVPSRMHAVRGRDAGATL
jgi:hypothetical protein